MKPVEWIGKSQEALRKFPEKVRRNMGYALHFAQHGNKHPAAKPLKGFSGASVLEIVEDYDGDTYRAMYTVKFAGTVYVLHAFQKKAKKGIATPKREMDLVQVSSQAGGKDFQERAKDMSNVTKGSGNVFADLGLPESDELLAKAELTRQIYNIIKGRKLTQKAAAELLEIAQPDVSSLMNGRFTGFSTECLFHLLNALDRDVEIVIRRKPADQKAARVSVIAA